VAGVGVAVGLGVTVSVGFGVGLNVGDGVAVATGVFVRGMVGTGVLVVVIDGDARIGQVVALDVNVKDGDIGSTVLAVEQEQSKKVQTTRTKKPDFACVCRYILFDRFTSFLCFTVLSIATF